MDFWSELLSRLHRERPDELRTDPLSEEEPGNSGSPSEPPPVLDDPEQNLSSPHSA